MDLAEAKEMSQQLFRILPEVELLTEGIDRKIKQLAEQYLASLDKKEDERFLHEAKDLLSLNQILAVIETCVPNRPDFREVVFDSFLQDVFNLKLGSKMNVFLNGKSFEYLALVHYLTLFFVNKNIFSEKAYFPPISKDTFESLNKTLEVGGRQQHNINLFKIERRFMIDKVRETTVKVMEELTNNPDPSQFTQEQIFAHYINNLIKNSISLFVDCKPNLLDNTEFYIDLAVGQLKQIVSYTRQILHGVID